MYKQKLTTAQAYRLIIGHALADSPGLRLIRQHADNTFQMGGVFTQSG